MYCAKRNFWYSLLKTHDWYNCSKFWNSDLNFISGIFNSVNTFCFPIHPHQSSLLQDSFSAMQINFFSKTQHEEKPLLSYLCKMIELCQAIVDLHENLIEYSFGLDSKIGYEGNRQYPIINQNCHAVHHTDRNGCSVPFRIGIEHSGTHLSDSPCMSRCLVLFQIGNRALRARNRMLC